MHRVLDAHALMVFLEKEPGFEKIEALFIAAVEDDEPLLMCTVNLGEVFYIVHRECGAAKAAEIEDLMHTLPIEIVAADWPLVRKAALLKSRYKLSYADCFAAALAQANKTELVTGDKEFKNIESLIKIMWIGGKT
ncbi:MAG: type II toxin-antitoxin system VapC family toxin [Candidatus Aminicenantes bacterium]|nr:type II toxin-antitoxin system VapC family toxin [Candidatus Aminicenantes bacterium]